MNNIEILLTKFNALSFRERALVWAGVFLIIGVLVDFSFTDSSKLKAAKVEIKKSSAELAELIGQRQSITLPPSVVTPPPEPKEVFAKIVEAKRDKLILDEVGGHKLFGDIASNQLLGITRLELQEAGKESEEFHGLFVHSLSLEGAADWGAVQDLMSNYLSSANLSVIKFKLTDSQIVPGRVFYSFSILVLSDRQNWYEPKKVGR